jgi:3-methylfumaryl-CoA hydratase
MNDRTGETGEHGRVNRADQHAGGQKPASRRRGPLTEWKSTPEVIADVLVPGPAVGLAGLFDLDPVPVGEALPPLWHWVYFLERPKQSQIDTDGHPMRGSFMPPIDLPQRMFAGGRAEFLAPLRVGEAAVREGTVASERKTDGRSGPLVFVTVRYEISGAAGLAVIEEQDIVYRLSASGRAAEPPPAAPTPVPATPWRSSLEPDPVLLFRFSALTYNGHRIHYDRPYATEVAGYPGLVVHGPLVALSLLELARARETDRPVTRFSFRARRPLFDDGPITLTGDPAPSGDSAELAAYSPQGQFAMTAEVIFGPAG